MQRQRILKKCQVCKKDAEYTCGSCNNAYYCSQQHQKSHWRTHKNACRSKTPKKSKEDQRNQKINRQRMELRKEYYQNFSVQKFEECYEISKVLQKIQENNLETTHNIFDQFEHGAAVCLTIRSLILLAERMIAKLKLEEYLKNNKILDDIRNLPYRQKKQKFNATTIEFFIKKLSLISTLANLSYVLGIPCISLYILYTQNIQYVFGEQSLEVSNCYFLIGCYYAEQNHFIKAIACFKRAALLRGQQSDDCYYNLGILYKWLGKNIKSIQNFQKALVKRRQKYGDLTIKVAQVYESLGLVYMQELDFKTAVSKFESAYMIRSVDPLHPEFKRLSQLLTYISKKIDIYIKNGKLGLQKSEIFTHYKESSKQNKQVPKQLIQKLKELQLKGNQKENYIQQREKQGIQMDPQGLLKIQKKLSKNLQGNQQKQNEKSKLKDKNYVQQLNFKLIISPQLVQKLSPFETFHLSELQLELEDCHTQYRAIKIANNSKFIKCLDKERLKLFKISNPHVFGEIHISNINPGYK